MKIKMKESSRAGLRVLGEQIDEMSSAEVMKNSR